MRAKRGAMRASSGVMREERGDEGGEKVSLKIGQLGFVYSVENCKRSSYRKNN